MVRIPTSQWSEQPWEPRDAPRHARPDLRRPTPVPATRTPAEPLALTPLAEPVRLFDRRRGQRYELVAAGPRGGVLERDPDGQPAPSVGLRMTLIGPQHAMVQFVVQVEGPADPPAAGGAERLRVRWVVITASERRSHLLEALHSVLGLDDERLTAGSDQLPPARRVVYEAERRSIREIGLVAPPPTAGRATTGRWSTAR